MRLSRDGREGELGERFCDTNDSFELTDGNRDTRAGVGFNLCSVDLSTDCDKVGGKLLSCFGAETRSASSKEC